MTDSGFSLFGSVSGSSSGLAPPSGTIQFSSGSLKADDNGSITSVNNSQRRRFWCRKARKFPVSSSSNSVDYSNITSTATSESFFGFGPFSSTTIQPTEINAKSSHEKECENSSEIQQNNEAKEAKQEAALLSTSLIVMSSILKGIPQNPHFYQLRNYSQLVKKSMIASWNSIFEETVEQIQSLQANDFWVRAEELWKTLEELHTFGYNVVPLRRRLVELSNVLAEVKSSKLRIRRLKIKAENHRAEKYRLEFVILNLQEIIRKEQVCMERALGQATDMENELPKFEGTFAKLAMEAL